MSQYFASMFRRRPNDGWFRVSRYDATTVDILCALAVSTMFLYAVSPGLLLDLAFIPRSVRDGQVWRLFTWPVVTPPDFFAIFGVVFFWVFGQQLEGLFGRNRFLIWVGAVTVVPAMILTVLSAVVPDLDFFLTRLESVEIGLSTLFLCGIWVYAATYPNVRWFEIMPLWGLAAIFTVLNLLQYTGARNGGKIVFLFATIAVALSAGRSLGLATAWPIPHIPIGSGSSRSSRVKPTKPKRRPSGRGSLGSRVVEGPWDRSPAPSGPPLRPTASPADQAELDRLLDKIGSDGMDSLSRDEKVRLNELSKRLRNR